MQSGLHCRPDEGRLGLGGGLPGRIKRTTDETCRKGSMQTELAKEAERRRNACTCVVTRNC